MTPLLWRRTEKLSVLWSHLEAFITRHYQKSLNASSCDATHHRFLSFQTSPENRPAPSVLNVLSLKTVLPFLQQLSSAMIVAFIVRTQIESLRILIALQFASSCWNSHLVSFFIHIADCVGAPVLLPQRKLVCLCARYLTKWPADADEKSAARWE